MTVFHDLTEYTYLSEFVRPGTKNIGWLGEAGDLKVANHSDSVLNLIWNACGISIAQTRGIHLCPVCQKFSANRAQRGSESLLLGSSEIRVFSRAGDIYAAPTLVYHYMEVHRYCPPEEFLTALVEGLIPPSDEYFVKLQMLNLSWRKTSNPPPVRFRFVKQQDLTIVKVPIEDDDEAAEVG